MRRLFAKAIEKVPTGLPFMVFIDINAPLEPETEAFDKQWQQDIRRWMDRFPTPTAENPDVYNALYVTNFSPHYEGRRLGPAWRVDGRPAALRSNTSGHRPDRDARSRLTAYHRVPEITESNATDAGLN